MVKQQCKLTGLTMERKEINQNGYSKKHYSEYQRMRNYAKKQLNQSFSIADYRKVMGFEVVGKKSLSEELKQKVRVYFHEG